MNTANVYTEIASQSLSLADKLASNTDLSNTVLALLGRLIIMCSQKGTPLEGLAVSPITTRMDNGEYILATQLTFRSVSANRTTLWQPDNEFTVFTDSRAHGLALALSKNKALSRFFQALVEKIAAYGEYHRTEFKRLKIQHPFISKDDVLVIGIWRDTPQ